MPYNLTRDYTWHSWWPIPIVYYTFQDVYDKDTFTRDDSMGNAEIDIKPCIECLRMELQGLPDGTKVDRIQPSRNNCLADESCIIWNKGKMTQDMVLRLRNVESGEVEVQIEWIDLPGRKGIQGWGMLYICLLYVVWRFKHPYVINYVLLSTIEPW